MRLRPHRREGNTDANCLHRNNILTGHMRVLGVDPELRKAILDDPSRSRSELPVELYLGVVEGYRRGFRTVFIMLTSLAVFSFVVTLLLIPQRSLDRPDDEQLQREGKLFVEKLEKAKEMKGMDEGKM